MMYSVPCMYYFFYPFIFFYQYKWAIIILHFIEKVIEAQRWARLWISWEMAKTGQRSEGACGSSWCVSHASGVGVATASPMWQGEETWGGEEHLECGIGWGGPQIVSGIWCSRPPNSELYAAGPQLTLIWSLVCTSYLNHTFSPSLLASVLTC